MLNYRQEDGSAHGAEHEKRREPHVILQEIGEIVVVEDDKDERDDRDEDDEDQSVEQSALELPRGGVGGGFEVDEVGGGPDGADGGGGGGGGEGVNEENHQEHADRDRRHHADNFDAESIEDARIHGGFWVRVRVRFFGEMRDKTGTLISTLFGNGEKVTERMILQLSLTIYIYIYIYIYCALF